MNGVEQLIKKHNLIVKGDIVGVAVSGGTDSMALLHYLNSIKKSVGFEILAITIDHGLRESSIYDVQFVVNYCVKNNIDVLKFKANLKEKPSKLTIEERARNFRYSIFEELVEKKVVTKIALGQHLQDQAETILLNIFRGAGLIGASGMEVFRDGIYIRPFLKTPKTEILAYINANEVPYVEDETNSQNEFSRNYIRNLIMPLIRNKWKNADQTISQFGEICRQDDEYISQTISDDGVVFENAGTVKIPVTYFVYPEPVLNRLILKTLRKIGVRQDTESKHIKLITELALNGDNGSGINLPNKVQAIKEYNFLTITNRNFKPKPIEWQFKVGKTDISGFGVLEVKRTKNLNLQEFDHVIDGKKLPKGAVWRYRQDGDNFKKFGGGTKLLSDFLTDKKIPRRIRTHLPVLALGHEVFVVAGVEISDTVKVDKDSTSLIGINAVKF